MSSDLIHSVATPVDWAGVRANIDLKKVKPFVGGVRLVGKPRFKFDDDPVKNALSALSHFFGPELEKRAKKLISFCSSQFFMEYSHRPTPAELSLTLKTVDFWSGGLSGFYTLLNKVSLLPEADPSVVFKPRLTSWLLEEKDYDQTEVWEEMDNIMRSYVKPRPDTLSFRDFLLNRDLWAASGATDNKRDIRPGLARTKAGFAYSLSDSALVKWWNRSCDEIRVWSLIKKEEPGAVRMVVLTDIVTYIKQAYLFYYFDRMMTDHPYLHAQSSDPASWWRDAIREPGPFALGDYRNYDESATRWLINKFSTNLINIVGLPPDEDFAHIGTLPHQLFNARVKLPDGSVAPVLNGLASGLRMTTMFNSIFNAALLRVAARKLSFPPSFIRVLGDDSVLRVPEHVTIQSLSDAIAPSGVTLHPLKSYISSSIEFLKLSVIGGRVLGNPLRSMRALLWSSEEEREAGGVLSVLHQRAAIWAKFLSRSGIDFRRVFPDMCSDMSNATGLTRSLVSVFLSTSSSLGGGGFEPRYSLLFTQPIDDLSRPYRAPSIFVPKIVFPLWRSGIRARMAGLSPSRVEYSKLRFFAIPPTRVFGTTDFSKPKPVGVIPPLGKNHDLVKYAFSGIRSYREFRENSSSLFSLSPLNHSIVASLFKRFSQRMAVRALGGSDPLSVGVAPWMTIQYGEVLDQFPSRVCSNIARLSVGNVRLSSALADAIRHAAEVRVYGDPTVCRA